MPLGNGAIPSPGPNARRVEQQITLIPQGERWLFALDRPIGVRPSSGVQAQLYTADVLENRLPIYSKVIYTAVSEMHPADPPMTPGRRASFHPTAPGHQ